MPCLNERQSLPFCISNAKQALALIEERYGLSGEIVIADNGSTDGSQWLAEIMGARVEPVSERGYGAALIGGCRGARGRFLLMGDADGSYDFTDGVAMIGRLAGGADLCMGSRFQGGIAPGAMPWKNRYIGNPALTGVLNLFFRSGIDDAHCGLRAITKDAFLTCGLASTGMEFASEMVVKASLRRLRIEQVPAKLSPDLRNRAPHLRPWRDGWRHLRYLLMLSPTWVFGVPALAAMLAACLIFAVATLHATGVLPGTSYFGASWTIVAGFMLSVGHLSAIMALAAHFHGVRSGQRPLRPSLAKLRSILTLEHAVVAGAGLIVVSLAALGFIGARWSAGGFAALPSVLPLTLAVSLGAVGAQTLLGGFLLAIIAGHEAEFIKGTGPKPPPLPGCSRLQSASAPSGPPPAVTVDPQSDEIAEGMLARHIRRSPRYAAVSLVCLALHNAIMIGLDRIGLHYALCLTASAAVLLPVGYVLQNRVTFNGEMSWGSFVRYSLALITNYPVSLATLWVLCDLLRLDMLYAAPISAGVLFVWNYATSQWALGRRDKEATGSIHG